MADRQDRRFGPSRDRAKRRYRCHAASGTRGEPRKAALGPVVRFAQGGLFGPAGCCLNEANLRDSPLDLPTGSQGCRRCLGNTCQGREGGRQNLRFPKAAQLACARGTGSTPELRASNVQVLPTGGYCWSSRRSRQPGRPSRSGARPHEETETRLYKPPRR